MGKTCFAKEWVIVAKLSINKRFVAQLVFLDVVAVENFQFSLDKVSLVAQYLDLLLVGFDHG